MIEVCVCVCGSNVWSSGELQLTLQEGRARYRHREPPCGGVVTVERFRVLGADKVLWKQYTWETEGQAGAGSQ